MLSGRICQDSGSPLIEDATSKGCNEATKPPDAFIADRVKHSGLTQERYKPAKSPLGFEDSFRGTEEVRERLLRIEPETEREDALRYIKDAGYALFMSRSKEGILRSNSRDLVPPYEDLLLCRRDDSNRAKLEIIVSEIRESRIEKDHVETQAQRMKAAFNLIRAMEIKSCT